jgi:hypothetical protein
VTNQEAASIDNNKTVNFNRRGEYGSAMNALFLFANASIQGTATLLSAMKSPAVQKMIAGVVAAGFAQEMLAALIFPAPDDKDDKDKSGLSGYDQIKEWEKQGNMIIPYGSRPGDYWKLPMPYGYSFFHNIGRLSAAYLRGAPEETGKPVTAARTIAKLTASLGQNFLPVSLIPTIGQPFLEVATNTNWQGNKIMPDKFPGDKTPDAYRQFESVSVLSPPIAQALNSMTGGDAYQAGEIDISPESIDHVVSFFMGGALNKVGELISTGTKLGKEALGLAAEDPQMTAANIPFIRRVVGSASPWQLKDITYRRIDEVDTVNKRVDGALDDLKAARDPADKAAIRVSLQRLRKENRAILGLDKEATAMQRQLGKMRKERLAILGSNQPAATKRERTAKLREREQQQMVRFNRLYFNALRRDQAKPQALAPAA